MERPYIILHMVTSIDGKVTGDFLSNDKAIEICEDYYRIHREYKADGFICGRITMEGSFTGGKSPELDKFKGVEVKRCDKVAKKADLYAISIDPHGRLGWYDSDISDYDPGYDKAHIVEALTDMVSDEYIAFLDSKNISYVFCGKDKIDASLLLEKLYKLFGIQKLMLEGGGLTDTLFFTKNLIDEISLVMTPIIDGCGDGIDLFAKKSGECVEFTLNKAIPLDSGGLWLNFKK